MPIYNFRCDECFHRWEQDLPIGEMIDDCPKCEEKGSVSKILPEFSIRRDASEQLTKPTGKEVEEHIKDNEQILEDMKKELETLEFKP